MKLLIELDLDQEGKACPGELQHALRDIARAIYDVTGIGPNGEPYAKDPIRDLREKHFGVHFGGNLLHNNVVWGQYEVIDTPFVERPLDGPVRASARRDGPTYNHKPN